eukprot:29330-Pelagococcus_subviridis.AAC.2
MVVGVVVVREDGAVLHDDVEAVHAVRVRQPLDVLVRRPTRLELVHRVRDVRLPRAQKHVAQLVLFVRAHAAQVPDDAETLRELRGAAEAIDEFRAHRGRRLRGVLRERLHDRDDVRVRARELANEVFEVERLVVVAVPRARVLQRRRFEHVE